jgi:hypothetical protein
MTQDPSDRPLPRRGRPPVTEKRLDDMVSTRLPAAQYQQLTKLADLREISLSTLVRELLVLRLR